MQSRNQKSTRPCKDVNTTLIAAQLRNPFLLISRTLHHRRQLGLPRGILNNSTATRQAPGHPRSSQNWLPRLRRRNSVKPLRSSDQESGRRRARSHDFRRLAGNHRKPVNNLGLVQHDERNISPRPRDLSGHAERPTKTIRHCRADMIAPRRSKPCNRH